MPEVIASCSSRMATPAMVLDRIGNGQTVAILDQTTALAFMKARRQIWRTSHLTMFAISTSYPSHSINSVDSQ